jgi:hypothetical protein
MKIAAILSFGASFLLPCSNANQLADDPPSYFGSVNNVAYLSWLDSNNIEAKYNNSVYIPSIDQTSGAAVHWSVDDDYIYLAVAARASGWVGFGFSDAGGEFMAANNIVRCSPSDRPSSLPAYVHSYWP